MSQQRSSAAVGWTTFAGIMMILIGVFHAIAGLSGILKDDFYAVLPNYVLKFDVTTWGWIHLIGGASSSCLPVSASSAARCGHGRSA